MGKSRTRATRGVYSRLGFHVKFLWTAVAIKATLAFLLGQDTAGLTMRRVVHPEYTEEARLARLEGRVQVEYKIRDNGTASDLRITRSLGLGLDEKMIDALRLSPWEASPGSPGVSTVAVDGDFVLAPLSRWHLIGVTFLPPAGVTRPSFASVTYPLGAGISVYAFDEGRIVGAMGRQATAKLAFDIDDHGVPGHFRVIRASEDIWGAEAILLVSGWRFNPGRRGGESVGVPCLLDLVWGPKELPIEVVEKLRLAINEPGLPVTGPQPRPAIIYSPQPPYTDQALAARLEGTVIISLVVSVDGSPKDLTVIRPLGMGLDQSAIQTVSTWQFQAPVVNGRPKEVSTSVEVVFSLHEKE